MAKLKEVGKVKDAHALKGELYVLIFSGDATWAKQLKNFSLKTKDGLQSFEVERAKPHKDGLILKAKGIDDRNQSEAVKGAAFFVDEDVFTSKKGETIYLTEILNFKVYDREVDTGFIKAFSSNGSQDLLVIDKGGKEFLVPFVEAFIKEIDFENKVLHMDLPDGLFDEN